MSKSISLLLGVHAHQPVGNFPSVIAEAHERCYRPFLQTLHRYPAFRYAAHFSGWLLDELCTRYPADMDLLAEMVARGQVELFGAGDCEPVLAAIPARDRVGQLEALARRLQRRFGAVPSGAWLTERVWESSVVPALADSGITYVTVDDYHFLCTGREERELDGYFTTEEDGRTLDLFPISEQLRYRLPFSPASEVVQYLESLANTGQAAAVYFDDIEKFGIWPETYDWVYTRRWLEQFIEGVLNSAQITTETYADFHRRVATRGIVYLPTASYSEMNEWTLPAPAAEAYAALLAQAKAGPTWPRERPFIRGGIWRNFLSRYPEANWLHKRMLGLSSRLEADPVAGKDPTLRDALYRAQANDAYWHGLFGGLYLPHLRRAVWQNLLFLETALDAGGQQRSAAPVDIDHDGAREHFMANDAVQLVLRDDGLGALHEFSSYLLTHNFGDVLRRHAEHYHHLPDADAQTAANPAHGGIASAHDRVSFKHEITASDLTPDSTGRVLFADAVVLADGRTVGLDCYRLTEFSTGGATLVAKLPAIDVSVTKRYRLTALGFEVSYTLDAPAGCELSTELNLAMPSCDGYGGRYRLPDGSFPGGFGQALQLASCSRLDCEDAELEGSVSVEADAAVAIDASPHFTVSQSEAGLEKIMQGACLRLRWGARERGLAVNLRPCSSWL